MWSMDGSVTGDSKRRKTANKKIKEEGKKFNKSKRAVSSEKVPTKMHKMCRFISSCAIARYHPGFCSPLRKHAYSNI